MKTIFENVINRGTYDLTGILKKIDSYHIEGKLTDAERDELYTLARGGANAANGVDVMKKLAELESGQKELASRVKALEDANGGASPDAPTEEQEPAAEYTAGKWYYKGDRVTFEGQEYTCTAPEGQVCVWSPAEHPAYWELNEQAEAAE